ncbi:SNARE associated Golgi protein [Balamuthia mandrillaris]
MKLKVLTVFKVLSLALLLSMVIAAVVLLFVPGSPLESILLTFLNWLRSIPKVWSALLLGLVQTVVLVLMLPGTPLNLACGFLFGPWIGSAVSLTSTDLSVVISFLIARYLCRDWAAKQIAQRPKFKAVDSALSKQGMYIIFLIRLSPVFPFGLCNYFFALTEVTFLKYWLASSAGLFPFTVAYSYLGSLMREIADIFTDGSKGNATQQIIFISLGGAATVISVVLVAVITRQALRKATLEQRSATAQREAEEDLSMDELESGLASWPEGSSLHARSPSTKRNSPTTTEDEDEESLLLEVT